MNTSRDELRLGRRQGRPDTRAAILAAARARFAEVGYEAASVRGIARRAKVDQSLVHYFFGTKEGLFAAALELPAGPADIISAAFEAGPQSAGHRLVEALVAMFESPDGRQQFAALVRSAVTGQRPLALFQSFISHVVHELSIRMPGADAERRAGLIMAHMVGLFLYRYLIPTYPLVAMSADEVVACVAPVIQHYIDTPRGAGREASG